jgi:beta-1,4-mannooligosaccharide/beta-1,4-mannosyl-N-acetylglucosamine phosphorylase
MMAARMIQVGLSSIAPEAPYEISGGFRNNVIFPGGMIIEDNGEVKIY